MPAPLSQPVPPARSRPTTARTRAVPTDSSLPAPRPVPTDSSLRRPRPVPPASLLSLALTTLLACGPPPEQPGPAAKAAARDLWQTRCVTCHGPQGRGDGPSGRALIQRPRDFHDASFQARATDDHLRRVIVEGGHAVGLSRDMAANPDLESRPAVVDELVQIVRSFSAP